MTFVSARSFARLRTITTTVTFPRIDERARRERERDWAEVLNPRASAIVAFLGIINCTKRVRAGDEAG